MAVTVLLNPLIHPHKIQLVLYYIYTQADAEKADEVDTPASSNVAQLPEDKKQEHTPVSDTPPVAVVSKIPDADSQPEGVDKENSRQPQTSDVQLVDKSGPFEQMETSPVKQPMTEENVVAKLQDDTEAAPMDTSSQVSPVSEQTVEVAKRAMIQPEKISVAHPENVESAVKPKVSDTAEPQPKQISSHQDLAIIPEKQEVKQQGVTQQPSKQQEVTEQAVPKQAVKQQDFLKQALTQEDVPKRTVILQDVVKPAAKQQDIPSPSQKSSQKQRLSQQMETPSKGAPRQSVSPSTKETVSQQDVVPLRQQVTQEVKQVCG